MMHNKLLTLVLSLAIALYSPSSVASASVVSPLRTVGTVAAKCAPAQFAATKCTAVMDEVRKAPVYYPIVDWREIDDRLLTQAEINALTKKRGAGVGIIAETNNIAGVDNAGNVNEETYSRLSNRINTSQRTHVVVLGMYDRLNSSLRVVATKIERGVQRQRNAAGEIVRDDDGKAKLNDYRVRMFQAVIGPQHFDFYKATRAFLPDDDKADKTQEGINPFARFDKSDSSELFENIDLSAAIVALSKAQSLVGADVAFMALATPRMDSRTRTKKSLLKKTVKTYVQAYVKPEWMMFVSNRAGGYALSGGITSAFCAVPLRENADGAGGNCPPESVVNAESVGLAFDAGNMPLEEEYLTEQLYAKKSGFSVLSLAFLAAVVFAFGGYLMAPEFLSAGAAAKSGISVNAIGAWVGASAGFNGYLILSSLIDGASPGEYQTAVLGQEVSFGIAYDTPDDFGELSVGSTAYKNFGGTFGQEVSAKFTTRDPANASISAIQCFWGGGDPSDENCGARGAVENFNIEAASAERERYITATSSKAAAQIRALRESIRAAANATRQSGAQKLDDVLQGGHLIYSRKSHQWGSVAKVEGDVVHLYTWYRHKPSPWQRSVKVDKTFQFTKTQLARMLDSDNYSVHAN